MDYRVADLNLAVDDAAMAAGAKVDSTTLANVGRMLYGHVGRAACHRVRRLAVDPRRSVRPAEQPSCPLNVRAISMSRPPRLDNASYAAEIVDEAYNRTLRVAGPDGQELWINGEQQDLYGYRFLG